MSERPDEEGEGVRLVFASNGDGSWKVWLDGFRVEDKHAWGADGRLADRGDLVRWYWAARRAMQGDQP